MWISESKSVATNHCKKVKCESLRVNQLLKATTLQNKWNLNNRQWISHYKPLQNTWTGLLWITRNSLARNAVSRMTIRWNVPSHSKSHSHNQAATWALHERAEVTKSRESSSKSRAMYDLIQGMRKALPSRRVPDMRSNQGPFSWNLILAVECSKYAMEDWKRSIVDKGAYPLGDRDTERGFWLHYVQFWNIFHVDVGMYVKDTV